MLWSSPVCLVCNGHCTLVAFLRIGADENRAAIFDVQHKSISLPKVPIQQNFALKCNPAELLCGVGHLNGAKALQVAANSGGVGDDKGVLPLRERIQQFVDAVCHPGADLTEGLAVRILKSGSSYWRFQNEASCPVVSPVRRSARRVSCRTGSPSSCAVWSARSEGDDQTSETVRKASF